MPGIRASRMPAWNPNLRSRTAIRTSDTRYFVDPSIATAALGLGPEDLIRDMNTFGLFFEVMAVRDLRVYADSLDGQVYHYRDKNGLECDAVLHLRNGKFGLIEIKLQNRYHENEPSLLPNGSHGGGAVRLPTERWRLGGADRVFKGLNETKITSPPKISRPSLSHTSAVPSS